MEISKDKANLLNINKIRYVVNNHNYRPSDIEAHADILPSLLFLYRTKGVDVNKMSIRIAKQFIEFFDKVSNSPLDNYEEDIVDINIVKYVLDNKDYAAYHIGKTVKISRQQISKYRKQSDLLENMAIKTARELIKYYEIMNP